MFKCRLHSMTQSLFIYIFFYKYHMMYILSKVNSNLINTVSYIQIGFNEENVHKLSKY